MTARSGPDRARRSGWGGRRLAGWAALHAFALAGLLAPSAVHATTAADCPPQAQAPTPEQLELATREARDRGFLWRIERDGRVSYLYGTIHVGRANWLVPGPRVSAAIAASDHIALELDLLDPDILRRLSEGFRPLPAESLPPALAARLQVLLAAECLPLEAMDRLSPSMQLATLTSVAARRDGLDPAFAIDGVLAVYARVLGKPVVSLETPELQVALLRGDPATLQERLAGGVSDLEQDRVRPMLLRVAQAWEEGNAEELENYEQWCDCATTDADRAEQRQLLDERNPALADRIAALHGSGAHVFAAVGTLHMFGAQGLPALLAQRGFRVERVGFARAP